MIQTEDILRVAIDLNLLPTKSEIQYVINNYESEQENDPSGNLELWIENLLYQQDITKITWVCSKCASHKVQTKMWVAINTNIPTGEVSDGETPDNWCQECKDHCKLKYIP